MPELPEVETVRTELEMNITGKVIDEIDVRRKNIRIPIPSLESLEGKKVKTIERRAKYIIVNFSNFKDALVIHLGMSGKILLGNHPRKKHDHVVFLFTDGTEMVFNDARRFGLITLKSLAAKLFEHLGPEPFSDDFSTQYLANKLKSRKTPIKVALLDQTLVVGVGNIYASEALFRSKINPKLMANKLKKPQATKLVKDIRKVLEEAIESGGSTLRDYVRSSGDTGYFQHKFLVYGKAGKPCPVCKAPIKKITQAGRSTFYCQNCQK